MMLMLFLWTERLSFAGKVDALTENDTFQTRVIL